MIQGSIWCWKLCLVGFLGICGANVASKDCAFAQITPDGTLGNESSAVTPNVDIQGVPSDRIDGGAIRGANLFHSFREFNIDEGQGVYFTNRPGIENIISRVTGSNPSNIFGKLGVLGNANLFLINPNGIIFGPNASLDIGGSFVATTANAIQFSNQGFFSASAPNEPGLLTVNPSALLFNQLAAGSITNNSREPAGQRLDTSNPLGVRDLFGLRVPDGRSLLLVGGNVSLNSGGLNALSGRVELGGLAGTGTVELNVNNNNLSLSFPSGVAQADVSLTRATVDTSGEGGGIQVQGRLIRLTDGQLVAATTGVEQPGNLTVNASESVELIGSSTSLATLTSGSGDAGNITINTRQLLVQDGAQVITSTIGTGLGGELTVNASDSVKLIGSFPLGFNNLESFSGLFSSTAADGKAGNITINTSRLLIQDGARVSTDSASLEGTPATGSAGALTVNALESVELIGTSRNGKPSSLSASTQGGAAAGNITINTENLIVQDRAVIAVSSGGTGDTGNLEVTARSIRLENEGKLTATSELGRGGGNIRLQDLDSLLLRGNSEISTNAGGEGNGGNIIINTNTLTALENSDITANAIEGRGGDIRIRTQGLFLSPDSEIIAESEQGIDGVVEINTLNADPNQGLVNLPEEVVDATGLVARGCPADTDVAGRGGSKFTVTGRGGLPPTPQEALNSDAVLEDWGKIAPTSNKPTRENQGDRTDSTPETSTTPDPFVPATGWVISANGQVTLTAQVPTVTSQNPSPTPASCNGT